LVITIDYYLLTNVTVHVCIFRRNWVGRWA